MTTVTSYAEQRIQQINQRIMSTTRLLAVIQQMDLYPELRDKWTTEEVVAKMRESTTLEPISTEVIDRRTGRPATATIALELSYEGKNPRKVQQVTNTLTSLFLEENIKERVKQVEETSTFLEGELQRVKADMATLESKIAVFKEEHINELPEMLQVNQQSLNNIERNIEKTNEQLRNLREREGYLRTQLIGVEPHLKDEQEQATREHLQVLRVQLVDMKTRYTDQNPDIIKLRAQITDLEQQLADMEAEKKGAGNRPDNPAYINLSAQLASTYNDIRSLTRELTELNAEADKYRRRITATPRVEDQYRDLTMALSNTQLKYNDLAAKHMEARVATGLEKEQKGERFTLIEPPRLPEKPFKPNRLAIVLIGFVLGVGAGVGFAALREFSDDSVRSADQLEAAIGLPVLTGIPVIMTRKDIVARRRRRLATAAGVFLVIFAGVAVFHYQVMDLDVFWAKLMRKLAL
jgi:polysaccharide chain length determinant protein (PEP-CTERM system associated)